MEKYAKKRFYEILCQIMAQPSDTGSEAKRAHDSAGSPEHGEEEAS